MLISRNSHVSLYWTVCENIFFKILNRFKGTRPHPRVPFQMSTDAAGQVVVVMLFCLIA